MSGEVAADQSTPLEVIARRSGFTDASRFAGVFRTSYRVSPHEWRDMNRVEGDR